MIRGGVVCGVLACRSEDQLYCPRRGRCVAAVAVYCDGIDSCDDGIDEPANCSQSALSLSLSLADKTEKSEKQSLQLAEKSAERSTATVVI